MLNKYLSFLLIFFYINVNAQDKAINIIPLPVESILTNETFTLSSATTISYSSELGNSVAEMLVNKLNTATGFKIKAKQSKSGIIQLNINETPDGKLGPEGYFLEVTSKSIIIKANYPAGLFYGIQTLLQLLPNEIESKSMVKTNWQVQGIKITDYPRFVWRGLMLDVSRHFFTKAEVKKYIDNMVRYKFNTFHWHLTDDNGWRIEIKTLPKLTQVGAWRVDRAGQFGSRENPQSNEKTTYGGFYTQDDIREIVKYAQDRFVTIVPEVDIPGHSMAAIASYPELCCTKDTSIKVNPGTSFADWFGNGTFRMNIDNTLNPSDAKVYEFLDKVFTEVAQLFPGQYIHVGGDECYKGYWKQDSGCIALMKSQNIRHVEDLQGYFMSKVNEIIKSKGKKMLGWDEIYEGGITKDAAVMCWHDSKVGVEAAKDGYKVVMTPSAFTYLDYYQGDATIEPPVYAGLRLSQCYSLNPSPSDTINKNILGGQGNLWTENVPTLRHAEYMAYPRAMALAEVFWSKNETKNWNNFIQRVEMHFERLDAAEINYSKAIYDVIVKPYNKDGKIWINLKTEAQQVDIFYTIDGTMPDNFSVNYKESFPLPEGQITLRIMVYRLGKPISHLITLKPEDIKSRML